MVAMRSVSFKNYVQVLGTQRKVDFKHLLLYLLLFLYVQVEAVQRLPCALCCNLEQQHDGALPFCDVSSSPAFDRGQLLGMNPEVDCKMYKTSVLGLLGSTFPQQGLKCFSHCCNS